MFIKIVGERKMADSVSRESGKPGWAFNHHEEALLECEEVAWNRMYARTAEDLKSAIGALLCCYPPSYEIYGNMPQEWSDRRKRFVFLRLISDSGSDMRPILISERSVYLMNNQGKTIERIC